jgi:hypothetical protein
MFLDNEPYIKVWRPVYRVLEPVIRRVKALILEIIALFPSRVGSELGRMQLQLLKMESEQAQLYSTLEQLLISTLGTRHEPPAPPSPDDPLIASTIQQINNSLAGIESRLAAQNAAQSAAIENLLVSLIASSSRTSKSWAETDERVHTLLTQQRFNEALSLLSDIPSRVEAQDTAKWLALENLIVGFMANSSRQAGQIKFGTGSQDTTRDSATRRATV